MWREEPLSKGRWILMSETRSTLSTHKPLLSILRPLLLKALNCGGSPLHSWSHSSTVFLELPVRQLQPTTFYIKSRIAGRTPPIMIGTHWNLNPFPLRDKKTYVLLVLR
jgi:hypothetical protein